MSSNTNDRSDRSAGSDRSNGSRRIRPSGGYRRLRSFRAATVIFDATALFCQRFLDPRSRTVDQMVQAARSGRQNIAEGSRASAASSQTELRLVSVARASLDELLLDYEDFLRQRGLRHWTKDDPDAQAVRQVAKTLPECQAPPADPADRSDLSDPPDPADPAGPSRRPSQPHPAAILALPHIRPYSQWLGHESPETAANAVICLIHQANYLLDRQIAALERDFVEGGGYSERLAAKRIARRGRATPEQCPAPSCPRCGRPMALRTARKGPNAGSQFWGCSGYPECRATRGLDADGG